MLRLQRTAFLGLLCVALANCTLPHVERYMLPEEISPGWVVVEYSNDQCESDMRPRYEVRIPPVGYMCTSRSLRGGVFIERYYLVNNDGSMDRLEVNEQIHRRHASVVNGTECKINAFVFWYGSDTSKIQGSGWEKITMHRPECAWGTASAHDVQGE